MAASKTERLQPGALIAMVTKRFYDHYMPRSFSPKLRAGLRLGAKKPRRVLPIRKAVASGG
jgi:hypothetical protein